MKSRSPTTFVRLVLVTSVSVLCLLAYAAGLVLAVLFLPLGYSILLLITGVVGPILLLALREILRHRGAIWFKPILMDDPVFGRIRYVPNRTLPHPGSWYSMAAPSFGNKLDQVEDLIIYADKDGPTERQRQVFRNLLDRFGDLALEIEGFLNADYLKWCDTVREETGHGDLGQVPDFPLFANSREVYGSVFFSSVEVVSDARERGPDCDVRLRICVPWEKEHHREILVKDARLHDWGAV